MKKFLNKARDKIASPSAAQSTFAQSQDGDQQSIVNPPTPRDVIRYRYHHGTNLGSIFVLEKWLHPSLFLPSAKGDSELDAVTAAVASQGIEGTRAMWEAHWHSALTPSDLDWLSREAKCTSIRLPVGYFTLGPEFCAGTPFEEVAGVYVNAWAAVRDVVGRARERGIGVLIDLHALPGGANAEAHSGCGSGRAELWGKKRNLEAAKRVLEAIVRGSEGVEDGVLGVQVCNEAVFDAQGMYEFYEAALEVIESVDRSLPVYVSDGWDLERCLKWSCERKGAGEGNPIVVDTHRYYTFSEKDRSQSPQEIIGRIGGELAELDGKEGSLADRGEAQVVVGEWSCVLDGQTWNRAAPEEKDGLVTQFGHVQSQKWQQRAGGSFFWTYKMEWMDGGEWGFAEQTKKGNLPPPSYLTLSFNDVQRMTQEALTRRSDMSNRASQAHEGYWNQTSPGQPFEHWRYREGWELGFSDAMNFFGMRSEGGLGENVQEGADKIGCLDIWVKKRMFESGHRGPFVWEWEQGYRMGVKNFDEAVLIEPNRN